MARKRSFEGFASPNNTLHLHLIPSGRQWIVVQRNVSRDQKVLTRRERLSTEAALEVYQQLVPCPCHIPLLLEGPIGSLLAIRRHAMHMRQQQLGSRRSVVRERSREEERQS